MNLPVARMRFARIISTCLVALLVSLPVNEASGAHSMALYRDLFDPANYNPKLRPVINHHDPLVIHVKFELHQIQWLDEKNQVLHTSGFIVARWKDEFLGWNMTEYGGIEDLIVPPKDVWLPDFGLINSAGPFYETTYFTDFRVHVSHDGHVIWSFGGNFQTSCLVDLTYFPFDEQKCHFIIENWAYPISQVNLVNDSADIHLDDYKPNGEWIMAGSYVTTDTFGHDIFADLKFPKVTFSMDMLRKSGYYRLNILTPCFIIVVLAMFMFWLPADSGEKVSLGITVLLAFSVFQLVIADNVPKSSDFVPILSIYVAVTMGITGLMTLTSIVVLYVHHHLPTKRVPQCVRIIFKFLGQLFCMEVQHFSTKEKSRIEPSSPDGKNWGSSDRLNPKIPDEPRVEEFTNSVPCLTPASPKGTDDAVAELVLHARYVTGKMKEADNDDEIIEEWKQLARVLDRVFFWIYFIAIVTVSAVILLRRPAGYTTDVTAEHESSTSEHE